MYAHSHNKMKKVEKFVGSLANGTQANNDKEAESNDGENSDLDELHMDGSRSQAEEEGTSERRWIPW